MTEPIKTEAPTEAGPRIDEASDFRVVYTNYVQGLYGPFDISLQLAHSFVEPGKEGYSVRWHTRVVMSPAEAMTLLNILTGTLKNYEDTWGKIVVPVFQPEAKAMLAQQLSEEKKTEGD